MVLGEGVEPPKALGRQIYSLMRLTTSLSQHIGTQLLHSLHRYTQAGFINSLCKKHFPKPNLTE